MHNAHVCTRSYNIDMSFESEFGFSVFGFIVHSKLVGDAKSFFTEDTQGLLERLGDH